MRVRKRELFVKFQADRGPQLAAMIAYYALLAFVPLMFLAVSMLGLFGRADESTYLVKELSRMFPESSVSTIVRAVNEIRANATVLGLIGLGLLVWTSLGLFGALESAFNIVYGRPNRSFFRGKALAAGLMIGLLVVLFAGLVLGVLGQDQLSQHAPGVAGNSVAAFILSVAASSARVVRLPLRLVLRADKRPAHATGRLARRARVDARAGADVPGSPAVSRSRPGVARLCRPSEGRSSSSSGCT